MKRHSVKGFQHPRAHLRRVSASSQAEAIRQRKVPMSHEGHCHQQMIVWDSRFTHMEWCLLSPPTHEDEQHLSPASQACRHAVSDSSAPLPPCLPEATGRRALYRSWRLYCQADCPTQGSVCSFYPGSLCVHTHTHTREQRGSHMCSHTCAYTNVHPYTCFYIHIMPLHTYIMHTYKLTHE